MSAVETMPPPRRLAAVVLGRAATGEADFVVTFLTREVGLASALAKNARRSIRRFGGGLLFPGRAAWYDFCFKPGRDLALVQRGELAGAPGPPTTPALYALAARALELVRHFEAPGNPAPDSFNLLVRHLADLSALETLEEHLTEARRLSLSFTLRYLELAGFGPHLSDCLVCGAAIRPEEPWWLDPAHGGLCCRRCRTAGAVPAPPDLAACFGGFAGAGALNAADLAAAEEFFAKLAERHLGRRLKSFRIVDAML